MSIPQKNTFHQVKLYIYIYINRIPNKIIVTLLVVVSHKSKSKNATRP